MFVCGPVSLPQQNFLRADRRWTLAYRSRKVTDPQGTLKEVSVHTTVVVHTTVLNRIMSLPTSAPGSSRPATVGGWPCSFSAGDAVQLAGTTQDLLQDIRAFGLRWRTGVVTPAKSF